MIIALLQYWLNDYCNIFDVFDMLQYFVLIGIIIILEVTAAILAFVYRNGVRQFLL